MEATIKTPTAALRGAPRHNAERVDEALHGWQVTILSQSGDFYHIRTDYGYTGHIHKDDLSLAAPPPNPRRIAQNFADIVAAPTVQGDVITSLPRGALVEFKGIADNHSRIALADGREAFIRNDFLEIPKKNLTRQNLVDNAMKYLGSPYRWGGKTPRGIDCSGLTFMAYHLCGLNIWRDAHHKDGYPLAKIDLKRAKPGDLLYFPGHVAMLLENDKIIHSAYANGIVKVQNLENSRELLENLLYCTSAFPTNSPFAT
ncbi:MAG: C40 family peptidase [Clostridiales bacterium]|jgi:beta-lactamase class A|nr:C40 family peptidase [Clostridiales bacterium]